MNNANAELLCLSLPSKCKTLTAAAQVHAFTCKTGLAGDPFIAGKLLLQCATVISDGLAYARRLLSHFSDPDAFMYNTLIRGLAESEAPIHAVETFKEMHRGNASRFDSFTFAFALKAATNSRSPGVGSQLHCRALAHGLGSHLFVATTLVSFYAECGALDAARKVFDETPDPNAVAWNAILTACFRCGDVKAGEALFRRMPVKNATSWNVVLSGYISSGDLGSAREAFRAMPIKDQVSWSTMIVGFSNNGFSHDAFAFFKALLRSGLSLNEASFTAVLSASAQAGDFDFARAAHGLAEKAGFARTVPFNNALLDAYSKSGNLGMARSVFAVMPGRKTVVSWSSMISALAMHGRGEEAMEAFNAMERSGTSPDGAAFVSILYSCSHAGLVEEGRRYFSKMREYGIEPSLEHYGCVVDLLGRAGQLEAAFRFASEMPVRPNAVIWRTLLGACSFHGAVELAERVNQKLAAVDPGDPGDSVLLSNIYASARKWDDAASVRGSMGLGKTPGWSAVRVGNSWVQFAAGSNRIEALEKLREVMTRLRVEAGYVPEIGGVLYDVEDEEKEDSVTRHSEKLAVAFAITRLRSREREAIKIVKNLRICRDCHTVMKLISKVYELEIVVRDRSRFHSFRQGSCSCGDYW